jgi:hypothetical protein
LAFVRANCARGFSIPFRARSLLLCAPFSSLSLSGVRLRITHESYSLELHRFGLSPAPSGEGFLRILAVFFSCLLSSSLSSISTSTSTSSSLFLSLSLSLSSTPSTAAMPFPPRSLKRAAALLACFVVVVAVSASSAENEAAAAATFAAAAPAAAAAEAPSPSSLEALDPNSAAIAAAAAAVDAATVDALLRIRAAVSPSAGGGSKKEEVLSEVVAAADGPLPAPSSLPAATAAGGGVEAAAPEEPSSLARESQDAYRSYRGLVPGSRFAELAPLGAFPGSPPARAESSALSGKATLTPPGEATSALLASLPPPSSAPAPSSSRGRGRNKPSPPSSPPKGDGASSNGAKRIWKVTVDAAAKKQGFEGWGTSLAWWALVVGSFAESVRNKVADLMFDAGKGLGLEVVR